MIPVRIHARTLEIELPPALLVGNRMDLIEAVTGGGLQPGLTAVRLDAGIVEQPAPAPRPLAGQGFNRVRQVKG